MDNFSKMKSRLSFQGRWLMVSDTNFKKIELSSEKSEFWKIYIDHYELDNFLILASFLMRTAGILTNKLF